MTRPTVFAVLPLLLSATIAVAQDGESRSETRRYDIRDLVVGSRRRPEVRLGMENGREPIRFAVRGMNRTGIDEDYVDVGAITCDALQTLIQEWISKGTWEGENTIKMAHDEWLVIRHVPETHARIAEVLATLRAHVVRPVRLDVAIYEGSPVAADELASGGPILDTSRLASLGGPGWRLRSANRVACRSGQQVLLYNAVRERYLRDFDLEIAEGAFILDPEVAGFKEGEAVVVEPTLSLDGEHLAVRCLFQRTAERLPRATFASGIRVQRAGALAVEPVNYEQPQLDTFGWGTHLRIPSGGAALVGVVGNGALVRALVVRHHRSEGDRRPKATDGVPTLFDVRFLTKLDDDVIGPAIQGYDDDPPSMVGCPAPSEGPRLRTWSPDILVEVFKSRVAPESWEQDAELAHTSGALIVRNTPAVLDEIARSIRDLEALQVPAFVVRARLLMGPRAVAFLTPVAGGHALDAEAKAAVAARLREVPDVVAVDLAVSGPVGRWVSVIDGGETTFVADYDAEIGKDSATLDPDVHTLTYGTSLSVLGVQTDVGHWSLQLGLDHAGLAEIERFPIHEGVDAQRPRVRRIDRVLEVTLPTAGTAVLDLGAGAYLLVDLSPAAAR